MTVTADQLDKWVGSFAQKARDYAHDPANFIYPGTSLEPHREHLRYAIRLEGWPSKILLWYTVDVRPDGAQWRHLSIQMSIMTATPEENLDQAELNMHKRMVLEQCEPIVKLFFPLHESFHVAVRAHEMRPVKNPATNQVTYRVPLTFDFLVRHDTTEGVIGSSRIQGLGGSTVLLDAHGREIPKEAKEALANVADAMQPKPIPAPAPRGQVIPLDEKRRRRAKSKAARRSRKKNRR